MKLSGKQGYDSLDLRKEGEKGFRHRETVVIDELTSRPQLVLATGGGAITQAPNRDYLKQRGIVVYLYTPVEIQLQRTYRDKTVPCYKSKILNRNSETCLQCGIRYTGKSHITSLRPIRELHGIWRSVF